MGQAGAILLSSGSLFPIVGATFEVAVAPGRSEDEPPILLKRPAPWLRARPEGAAALEREWQVLQRFTLDALPKPLFRGEDERGPFLAETLVPGVPLRALPERGFWTATRFRSVAWAAFSALAELHEHADARGSLGFVHGDLSPDNVFVDEAPSVPRVSFIDFGSATFRDAAAPVFPNARGTLPYAPPELVRGEQQPRAATDVYALAASLLTLVQPELTHASTEAALLVEVGERGLRLDALMSRTDFEASEKEALLRAVAFDPSERITSARELASVFARSPRGRDRC